MPVGGSSVCAGHWSFKGKACTILSVEWCIYSGASRFPLSPSEWSFTICLTP